MYYELAAAISILCVLYILFTIPIVQDTVHTCVGKCKEIFKMSNVTTTVHDDGVNQPIVDTTTTTTFVEYGIEPDDSTVNEVSIAAIGNAEFRAHTPMIQGIRDSVYKTKNTTGQLDPRIRNSHPEYHDDIARSDEMFGVPA